MRQLGKALVEEARKRSADGRRFDPLAGYLDSASQLVVLEPQAETNAEARQELVMKLRSLAREIKIISAALSNISEKQFLGGRFRKNIQVHLEHNSDLTLLSIPLNESDLVTGIPGVDAPAVAVSGARMNPFYSPRSSNACFPLELSTDFPFSALNFQL